VAPFFCRRAAQQLKRARTVVRRQLAGVALNGLASDVAVAGMSQEVSKWLVSGL